MDTATEILIIMLSVTLTVFLIVAIILSIYLIKLTKDIRSITTAAERTANNIEATVNNISKAVSPMFAAEMISRYINKFRNKGYKKGDE